MSLPVRRLISTACYALNPLARLALVVGVFRDSLERIKPQVEYKRQLEVELFAIISPWPDFQATKNPPKRVLVENAMKLEKEISIVVLHSKSTCG